jgi:hypothetical protein
VEGGFLPPEPPGPEPDFGARPRQQPPPAPPPEGPQQAPPGYWQPQQWQPPGAPEPDNGPAVTGFIMAVVGAGLLVLSVGLLAIVSLVLGILGVVYSRRGKRKIESGETTKHRGLAQAGFVTSIVTLVVAAPLTLLEIVFLILYASSEEFREDFEDELDEQFDDEFDSVSRPLPILVGLALPILRGIARLVA